VLLQVQKMEEEGLYIDGISLAKDAPPSIAGLDEQLKTSLITKNLNQVGSNLNTFRWRQWLMGYEPETKGHSPCSKLDPIEASSQKKLPLVEGGAQGVDASGPSYTPHCVCPFGSPPPSMLSFGGHVRAYPASVTFARLDVAQDSECSHWKSYNDCLKEESKCEWRSYVHYENNETFDKLPSLDYGVCTMRNEKKLYNQGMYRREEIISKFIFIIFSAALHNFLHFSSFFVLRTVLIFRDVAGVEGFRPATNHVIAEVKIEDAKRE